MHYWLASAFAKQRPEKSSNRFFLSRHAELLDATGILLEHCRDYKQELESSDETKSSGEIKSSDWFEFPDGFKSQPWFESIAELDSSEVMPLSQSICISSSLQKLAQNAKHYQRLLPELDDKRYSALKSEAKLACKLLIGKSKKRNSTGGATKQKKPSHRTDVQQLGD